MAVVAGRKAAYYASSAEPAVRQPVSGAIRGYWMFAFEVLLADILPESPCCMASSEQRMLKIYRLEPRSAKDQAK